MSKKKKNKINNNTIPVWKIKGNCIPLTNLNKHQLTVANSLCSNTENRELVTLGFEVRRTLKAVNLVNRIFENNISIIDGKVRIYR